ncbi:MAG: hypothetical protein GAK45_01648 [Pseudomonas citronellolis]|nr:MAG: hypothetical protein GAK45_01648 [Pseudomonas citronellolis]
MTETLRHIGDIPVLACSPEGPALDENALRVLISAAIGQASSLIALPASRLPDAFFNLRSGEAGRMLQTLANYHLHLVVIGDINSALKHSKAFHALVTESNRGSACWFVPDWPALMLRLQARHA